MYIYKRTIALIEIEIHVTESYNDNDRWRIEKDYDGEVKSHRFIRSDLLGSEQDANDLMLKKSQMFIDQMGEKIFD